MRPRRTLVPRSRCEIELDEEEREGGWTNDVVEPTGSASVTGVEPNILWESLTTTVGSRRDGRGEIQPYF
jgi:hypothetical protein